MIQAVFRRFQDKAVRTAEDALPEPPKLQRIISERGGAVESGQRSRRPQTDMPRSTSAADAARTSGAHAFVPPRPSLFCAVGGLRILQVELHSATEGRRRDRCSVLGGVGLLVPIVEAHLLH